MVVGAGSITHAGFGQLSDRIPSKVHSELTQKSSGSFLLGTTLHLSVFFSPSLPANMTGTSSQLNVEKPVQQILVLDELLKNSISEHLDDLSEDDDDEGSYSDDDDESLSEWSNSTDDDDENFDMKSRVSLMSLDALLALKATTTPHDRSIITHNDKNKGKATPVSATDIRSQRFQYRKSRPAPASRSITRSESMPKRMPRLSLTHIAQETSAQAIASHVKKNQAPMVKPADHYKMICEKAGKPIRFLPPEEVQDFFLPSLPENKAAHRMEIINAVRGQDLETVKTLHQQGYALDARSPATDESLLHVCARRGTPEILKYMLREGEVSPCVCCDYGRSPLHDAAWSTSERALEMLKILIYACPDMLMLNDRRGFSPLDYIPRDHWAHCCEFLDKHKEMILPTGLVKLD